MAATNFAVDAHVCGATGCRCTNDLMAVETEYGTRTLCSRCRRQLAEVGDD